ERESNWHGANAIDGTLAGVQLTPGKYRRALSWAAETDTNVWRSRCTASFSYGGTTYYPQEARCLERFLEDCQAAACTATTAGGLNQKGFYLVPDRTIYQGNGNLLSSMDGGGVKYSLSSSNDDYVYCHMQAGEKWQEPSPSIDGMLTYWDVELEAMTSETSPTWDEP
ncbi:MAG: hypothetical protein GY832_03060, partial [Chloroflexi bacterium]|nr:hypothetical protein [Chloroflexota bacterium]